MPAGIPLLRSAAVAVPVLLLLLSAACSPPEDGPAPDPGGASRRPANVLLITVDTLRADRLSCYGHPDRLTPQMDRLARRGAQFARAYSTANTTLPAHASLFTSLLPEGHGGLKNGVTIRQGLPSLARSCRNAGMATAAMVNTWVLGPDFGLAEGFDEYISVYKNERRRAPDRGDGRASGSSVRAADASRVASRWLRAHTGKPFLLWIHYMDPHQDYDPPPPYAPQPPGDPEAGHDPSDGSGRKQRNERRAASDPDQDLHTVRQFLDIHRERRALTDAQIRRIRARYDGEAAYTDAEIGWVLRLVERLGLSGDTLVVLAADHGEALYEHDCFVGHSASLHEPVAAVPIIIAGPGVAPGVRPHESATLLDLAPTILSLLGLEIPGTFQGRDLSRLLAPSAGPVRLPAPILLTRQEGGRAAWQVDGRKAVFSRGGRLIALYDLERDPKEQTDLREAHPGQARRLEQRYRVLRRNAGLPENPADAPGEAELDAATRRRLEAMGYVEQDLETERKRKRAKAAEMGRR